MHLCPWPSPRCCPRDRCFQSLPGSTKCDLSSLHIFSPVFVRPTKAVSCPWWFALLVWKIRFSPHHIHSYTPTSTELWWMFGLSINQHTFVVVRIGVLNTMNILRFRPTWAYFKLPVTSLFSTPSSSNITTVDIYCTALFKYRLHFVIIALIHTWYTVSHVYSS